jgi:hypothetical protein
VLHSWFYPAAEKAGLRKLNVKALRHSYASALINEGRPVTEVQYLMGHSAPVTTLAVYSHFFRARDNRKVADVVATIFDGTGTEKSGHSVDTAGSTARGVVDKQAKSLQAGMAELVDAPDSKSGSRKAVGVRVPLPACILCYRLRGTTSAVPPNAGPTDVEATRAAASRRSCSLVMYMTPTRLVERAAPLPLKRACANCFRTLSRLHSTRSPFPTPS